MNPAIKFFTFFSIFKILLTRDYFFKLANSKYLNDSQ